MKTIRVNDKTFYLENNEKVIGLVLVSPMNYSLIFPSSSNDQEQSSSKE